MAEDHKGGTSETDSARAEVADPEIRRRPRISIYWIIPLATLLIAAWVAYKEISDRGPLVTIEMQRANGLQVGKTRVKYRGIEVGTVEQISLVDDLSMVKVSARMIPSLADHLREGAAFWVVRPEVSLEGVKGLSTLVSGDFIAFEPGKGAPRLHFKGLDGPPDSFGDEDGLQVVLTSTSLGSVSAGSPVLFRGVRVGTVENVELLADDTVQANLVVNGSHAELVRDNSRFWVTGGLEISLGDLLDASLKLPSLTSLIAGGIAFDNPETPGEAAKPGASFPLFDEMPREFARAPDIAGLALRFRVKGFYEISVGAPITYQGFRVGKVVGATPEDEAGQFAVQAVIEEPYGVLVRKNSVFWVEGGVDLDLKSLLSSREAPVSLGELLGGGIAFATPPEKGEPAVADGLYELNATRPAFLDRESGVTLNLRSADLHGLAVNDPVLYRGFAVGKISSVKLAEDGTHFRVSAVVFQDYAQLVRRNSVFWNASGLRFQARDFLDATLDIESISSLLVGGIAFDAVGAPGPQAEDGARYHVLTKRPKSIAFAEGDGSRLQVVLETAALGGIAVDDPILYREFKVGKVAEVELSPDASKLLITGLIKDEYISLVKSNTVFWNASGFHASFGLFSGAKLDLESLGALVRGGIALATPPSGGQAVKNGAVFKLHDKPKAEWQAWAPHIRLPDQRQLRESYAGDQTTPASKSQGSAAEDGGSSQTADEASEGAVAPQPVPRDPVPDAVVLAAGAHASTASVSQALTALGFEGLSDFERSGNIIKLKASWQGETLALEVDMANGQITLR